MAAKAHPPAERLGYEPEISSEAELDQAMAELAWLAARQAELEAECKRQIEQATAKCQEAMFIQAGEWLVSFADRERVLMEALASYCNDHQAELLAKCKGRTRKLTHGEISWKKTPAGPAIADKRKPDDVAEAFVEEHGLRARFHELLQAIPVAGQPGEPGYCSAAEFFALQLKLKLDRVKEGREAGRLTEELLQLLGLTWDAGSDKLTYKAPKHLVRTEANLAEAG